MGADSPAENTFQPKMSAQDQKFEIFEKKLTLGVRSPCSNLSPFVNIYHLSSRETSTLLYVVTL